MKSIKDNLVLHDLRIAVSTVSELNNKVRICKAMGIEARMPDSESYFNLTEGEALMKCQLSCKELRKPESEALRLLDKAVLRYGHFKRTVQLNTGMIGIKRTAAGEFFLNRPALLAVLEKKHEELHLANKIR